MTHIPSWSDGNTAHRSPLSPIRTGTLPVKFARFRFFGAESPISVRAGSRQRKKIEGFLIAASETLPEGCSDNACALTEDPQPLNPYRAMA
jgi:hypothetical protein